MRIVEYILGGISGFSLLLVALQLPVGESLATISLSMLALLYGATGFALFNQISFQKMPPLSDPNEAATPTKILLGIVYGWLLGFTSIAILLKVQRMAQADLVLYLSLISLFTYTLGVAIWHFWQRSNFHLQIFSRCFIIGIIAILVSLLPAQIATTDTPTATPAKIEIVQ